MSEIRAQLIALVEKWRAEADQVDQGAGDWSELTGTLRECADELELLLRAAAEALASPARTTGNCTCGSANERSARFGQEHLGWCAIVPAPASREAPPPERTEDDDQFHLPIRDAAGVLTFRNGHASIEAPPPASNGWQAIETAPKDTTVLVCWADRQGWRPRVLFQTDDGWENDHGHSHSAPTHWMPLPLPPVPERRPPTNNMLASVDNATGTDRPTETRPRDLYPERT